MTPISSYQSQCAKAQIIPDQQQALAMLELQALYERLLAAHQRRKRVFARFRKPQPLKGIYLWGGVGVGKTFLMDTFYHCIPFHQKKRLHFHAFMKWVHHELKQHQGSKNPLDKIITTLAKDCRLLCLDELFVSDIADAMILANLFRALINHGVCLVITSNIVPDDLYKRGLQRPLFLPAIALLKEHTNIIHLIGGQDYRTRVLKNAGVFFAPDHGNGDRQIDLIFHALVDEEEPSLTPITICGRDIAVIKHCRHAVWFDFSTLCSIPRSQHDYLEIAAQYTTVCVSNAPTIPAKDRNSITLFIKLIDVLYDHRVRLILSSPYPIEEIYLEGPLSFEFKRTLSRLTEMQSEAYFLSKLSSS